LSNKAPKTAPCDCARAKRTAEMSGWYTPTMVILLVISSYHGRHGFSPH
jgi:hypothetical protein